MLVVRVSLKLLLLLIPLLLLQAAELMVLPPDVFAFRFWEAMITRQVYLLPGPFYPNRRLDKWTTGDQTPRGPRTKFVHFQSDEFGQRNPPNQGWQYDIVVIGDSNVVGSHVDESDTIRAALARRCNCGVYAYGPYLPFNILSFLSDQRFDVHPPKWVVMEFRPGDVEQRNLPVFRPCQPSPYPDGSMASRLCSLRNAPPGTEPLLRVLAWLGLGGRTEFLVLVDRLMKQSGYHYLQARLRLVSGTKPTPARHDATSVDVAHAIEAFRSYEVALARRGARLLLFSMHNQKVGPASVSPWLADLRRAGFDVVSIDATTTPADLFSRWWFDIDSHWREESIDFSASLMWQAITSK